MPRIPDTILRRVPARPRSLLPVPERAQQRAFSSDAPTQPPPPQKPRDKSRHASFYSDILPAWLPIIVIGSAVFLTLQMTRAHLAQERWTAEIRGEIAGLEGQYEEVQRARRGEQSPGPGPGPSEVLAATLPTLVKPTPPGPSSEPVQSQKQTAADGSPISRSGPAAAKSWWAKLVGR
ncbi:hypothetical protein CALVIDRAFT_540219 [Calocera viscosa TUFC12733]|uniref:Uncharacterized protein n=1 Tax=Calocera viscosa (strain TUFC12733) TaxID=1330018 RepID=A0A167J468_CALVF|nr:hypothetical protein CALVIDRAFT_540219 [Calocera viscosa TUFC12733]